MCRLRKWRASLCAVQLSSFLWFSKIVKGGLDAPAFFGYFLGGVRWLFGVEKKPVLQKEKQVRTQSKSKTCVKVDFWVWNSAKAAASIWVCLNTHVYVQSSEKSTSSTRSDDLNIWAIFWHFVHFLLQFTSDRTAIPSAKFTTELASGNSFSQTEPVTGTSGG